MVINIHSVLVIWGQMAREKGCKGYPTMESFCRESTSQGTSSIRLSDDTFFAIDKLFIALYDHDITQFQILRNKYIKGQDDVESYKSLNLNRRTYFTYLAYAKAFVTGGIIGRDIQVWV